MKNLTCDVFLFFIYCYFYEPEWKGYSQKDWVGVCGPLPKTLTLFMTKFCVFPYSIKTRPKIWSLHLARFLPPKHNLWRAFVGGLINNTKKVASSKKHAKLKTRVSQKSFPIYDQHSQNRYILFMNKTDEKHPLWGRTAARSPAHSLAHSFIHTHSSSSCEVRPSQH